jgi:tetratricopeptide (TPR) repeat protein
MSCKTRFVRLAFLLFTLLFWGCAGKNKAFKEVEMTPEEKKKADLLRQIDFKFERPEAHYELGQMYQADGLWTQAEYHYNVALSFEPTHRAAQAGIVKVLIGSGDATKAQLTAEIYMGQVSGTAAGSLQLALAFQKQGLDEYALACYRQALGLAPNSAKINAGGGW